jgi:hypothetical protein
VKLPFFEFFTASYAVGYVLAPLTGLRKRHPQGEGFISELLTHDTRNWQPHFPFSIFQFPLCNFYFLKEE